jgi:hypothetical protein
MGLGWKCSYSWSYRKNVRHREIWRDVDLTARGKTLKGAILNPLFFRQDDQARPGATTGCV